jgi:hypothetical protein
MRIYVIDVAAGEKIPRQGGLSQFRKTAVHCGVMPASRRPEQHNELTRVQIQIHPAQGLQVSVLAASCLTRQS